MKKEKDCPMTPDAYVTIKASTVQMIENVLAKDKKFYLNIHFPFCISKNGYRTHQGWVLANYLKTHGYVRVRVSEVSEDLFIGSHVYLKSTNTIIIKKEVFDAYSIVKRKREAFAKKPNVKSNLIGKSSVTFDNKSELIEKYVERLTNLKRNYALLCDFRGFHSQETIDLEARMRDISEFINDLRKL